jgi:hypothetical protein
MLQPLSTIDAALGQLGITAGFVFASPPSISTSARTRQIERVELAVRNVRDKWALLKGVVVEADKVRSLPQFASCETDDFLLRRGNGRSTSTLLQQTTNAPPSSPSRRYIHPITSPSKLPLAFRLFLPFLPVPSCPLPISRTSATPRRLKHSSSTPKFDTRSSPSTAPCSTTLLPSVFPQLTAFSTWSGSAWSSRFSTTSSTDATGRRRYPSASTPSPLPLRPYTRCLRHLPRSKRRFRLLSKDGFRQTLSGTSPDSSRAFSARRSGIEASCGTRSFRSERWRSW